MRVKKCRHVHITGMQSLKEPSVPLREASESNRLVLRCALTLVAVQLRLSLRDLALGPLVWLPVLVVLDPLLSDLLRSRHALQDTPPEHMVRI